MLIFIGTENVHKYPANEQNKYRKSLDPCVYSQYDSQLANMCTCSMVRNILVQKCIKLVDAVKYIKS